MDQISLLKMVWYPNVIDTHRHPIKNYKIFSQPINKQILQHFSAYVKLIATYSNWLCRSKNQSANFQRQKTNKKGGLLVLFKSRNCKYWLILHSPFKWEHLPSAYDQGTTGLGQFMQQRGGCPFSHLNQSICNSKSPMVTANTCYFLGTSNPFQVQNNTR